MLTYEHLLPIVWEEEPGADMSPMRTMVGKLRAKLGEDARNPHLYLHRNLDGLPDAGGGAGGGRQCRVINCEEAGAA